MMDLNKAFLYFAGFIGVVSICAIVFIGSGINFTYMSSDDIKTIAQLKCHGAHTFHDWLGTLKVQTSNGETATYDRLGYISKRPKQRAACTACGDAQQKEEALAQQIVITPIDWVIAAQSRRNRIGADVSKQHEQIACDRVRAFTEAVNQITYAYTMQGARAHKSNDPTCEKLKLTISPLIPPELPE